VRGTYLETGVNLVRIFLIYIVISSLSACDTAVTIDARIDSGEQADLAREIMTLESRWSDMFDAGDIDGIAAILAEDTVLIMPGSAPLVGIGAVRAATEDMLADDEADVSWKSTAAFVAPGGDMAWDYGVGTTVLADGSVVEGHYLVVWKREDGEWKIAADMFN
jgi:uncharacterized protein (TIGR02246 family)